MNTEAFESIKQGLKEAIEHAKIARRGDAARALFQKWIDEEVDQEHKETFEYLAEALDKDRLSDRKLFRVI